MPDRLWPLGIEKQDVGVPAIAPAIAVRRSAFPGDFVAEPVGAENAVEQQLEIMARGRVAVEIEAARGPEHAMQLDQPDRHHRQIGHHVVVAEERAHRGEHVEGARPPAVHHLVKGILRRVVPVPAVFERFDLCVRFAARCSAEQDVVIGIRIERRIEIDEIDAVIRHMRAQHIQIVPVKQMVGQLHLALPPHRAARER